MQRRRDSACCDLACHEPLNGTSVSEIAEKGSARERGPLAGRLPAAHVPCELRLDSRFSSAPRVAQRICSAAISPSSNPGFIESVGSGGVLLRIPIVASGLIWLAEIVVAAADSTLVFESPFRFLPRSVPVVESCR
jgi:hypothetical protein